MLALPRIAMSVANILLRLEQRAIAAESLITALKNELTQLENSADGNGRDQISALQRENENLKREVELWKKKLIEIESRKGVAQVFCTPPAALGNVSTPAETKPASPEIPSVPASAPQPVKKEKEAKKKKTEGKPAEPASKPEESPVDIGLVDLRVGKIVNVKKHPDADSLYVEEVDVGEEKTRTVVSGLVKYVPLEEMQNRLAIFMCNLKPAKMRGITSEGMLMCASTPEKVEILLPPEGSAPGDLVEVEGYARRPEAVMNPKRKIWETVAPDLKTDDNRAATYKGAIVTVKGKGPVVAPSLSNVQIK